VSERDWWDDVADEHVMIGRDVLRQQYSDDVRLTARQSLWRLRPGPSLYQTVLDLAALDGTETVVEVGCGNGCYLAELRSRGHAGPVLGLDLSEPLARQAGRYAATAVADAQALPLSDAGVDVVLCAHMLYHVPDIDRAIVELRRVVRPGGRVIVATNGAGHTAELKAVLAEAAARVAGIEIDRRWDTRRFESSDARVQLASHFGVVEQHSFGGPFAVTDPAVPSAYLASWPPEAVGPAAGETWDAIVSVASELIASHVAVHGAFTVTSNMSAFMCLP
jgi:SAM-dependent methyltransferase